MSARGAPIKSDASNKSSSLYMPSFANYFSRKCVWCILCICILDKSDIRDVRYWMIFLELSFFVLDWKAGLPVIELPSLSKSRSIACQMDMANHSEMVCYCVDFATQEAVYMTYLPSSLKWIKNIASCGPGNSSDPTGELSIGAILYKYIHIFFKFCG